MLTRPPVTPAAACQLPQLAVTSWSISASCARQKVYLSIRCTLGDIRLWVDDSLTSSAGAFLPLEENRTAEQPCVYHSTPERGKVEESESQLKERKLTTPVNERDVDWSIDLTYEMNLTSLDETNSTVDETRNPKPLKKAHSKSSTKTFNLNPPRKTRRQGASRHKRYAQTLNPTPSTPEPRQLKHETFQPQIRNSPPNLVSQNVMSFRKSSPPQNRQLIAYYSQSKC